MLLREGYVLMFQDEKINSWIIGNNNYVAFVKNIEKYIYIYILIRYV